MYCNNFKYGNKPSVLYMMSCRMKSFFLINLRIYYLIRNLNVFSLGAVFLNNVFSFQDTIHIKTMVYLCKKKKVYKNIWTFLCCTFGMHGLLSHKIQQIQQKGNQVWGITLIIIIIISCRRRSSSRSNFSELLNIASFSSCVRFNIFPDFTGHLNIVSSLPFVISGRNGFSQGRIVRVDVAYL